MADKSGIVAIVGRANVGKSTLMNHILEEKVSIVSRVAQTTRNLIRGVRTEERGQLVLLDTPGIHQASHDLGRLMNKTARLSIEGSDAILLVVDESERLRKEDDGWIRKIIKEDIPCVVALNKSDIRREPPTPFQERWAAIAREKEVDKEPTWISTSAKTGENVDRLVQTLFDLLPEGPPLFPEDILTDFPRRLNIADVIREKLFAQLRDEIPHAVAVWVEELEDIDGGMDIQAVVYVNRPSQKGIVIGEKGRLIRKIQRQAQAELHNMYEQRTRLRLRVKVQKDWARNHWILKQLGYV